MLKKSVIFVVVMLFITGCASVQKTTVESQPSDQTIMKSSDGTSVIDFIKSEEQIGLDKAKSKYKDALSEHNVAIKELKPTNVVGMDAQRAYIKERRAYVEMLKAELDTKIAKLEKKAKNSGYFGLGSKAAGILAGIASAILVAASPANTPYVAGLTGFSTGLIAMEGTISERGITAESQIEELKKAAHKSYVDNFREVNFDYLHSLAGTEDNQKWTNEMSKLGKGIVEFESVVKYTGFGVKLNTNNSH